MDNNATPLTSLATREDLASPDMVDFVTRFGDAIRAEIPEHPNLRISTLLEGDFAVVYVPRDEIADLIRTIGPGLLTNLPILMTLLGQPDLEASGILQVQQQPYLDLRGQGVVIGFVDTGIDYTQPAFQYENGTTKIQYIWDQTVEGTPPRDYPYGAEYTAEDINRALAAEAPLAVVPHADTVGHGTFLASVAASHQEGEYIGAAPDAGIIMVKLRGANAFHLEQYHISPDRENIFSSSDVMLGVEYIIDRANQLGMPAAICVGVGSNYGSHDGFNALDEYLAHISNQTGFAVCVAAGNEALARHHAEGIIQSTGESQDIEIQVEPGSTFMDVQLWNNGADRMSVSVTSPAGEVVGRIPARSGESTQILLTTGGTVVTVRYFFPNPRNGGQITWLQIVDPTPGIWAVTVYGDSIVEGFYNAWLPITGIGDPGVRFLTPSPNVTITEPATALGVLRVGAYSTYGLRLYPDSSWGPTRLPLLAPDLCAPGVDVSGIYPGGPGTMTGTSVAAAIAAGACALMLQWGIIRNNDPSINTFLIRAYFIRGCDRSPNIVYPNEQWGFGRLNLINTFTQLRATP